MLKGLSSPTIITAQPIELTPSISESIETQECDSLIDQVHAENNRIITTVNEQILFQIIQELLPNCELTSRDTESYFSVLFQNKNNRWLLRYDVNRKRPTIQFIVPVDDHRKNELTRAGLEVQPNGLIFIDKPDYLYRMVGILNDSFNFCINDENFKRTS